MKDSLKSIFPYILIVMGFAIASLAYFNPVLQGKQIFQNDIKHYKGMSRQQLDFREQTGEETYWTNSAFGGMPTYQLGARYPNNYIKDLDLALRFLPRPADYVFLYFVSFFILLLVLKVDYKLAALGALAFGFSTYYIIILGVGHNAKAHAIAYMPLVLSGIVLTFRKKYILGFLLTTVALGLELCANHYQMTYYLMLLVIVLGIAYAFDAYKKTEIPHFFKSVGILIIAVILAIGLNATNILATQEYVKESTRGQSELTINPDGTLKEVSKGLDKDYITEYSYGILETFNLFIPRFMGGGNAENVGKNSESYKFFRSLGASPVQATQQVERTPTYWGKQPYVEAPAYIGAVVVFLFVFALFLVKGRLRWWLLGGTVLSLLLSYGKNLGFITDFFINYVPLYNKFRAVSSMQVILELCVPLLAVFGLSRLFNSYEREENKQKALKFSVVITVGLSLIFLVFKSTLFDFNGLNDATYAQMYGQEFVDAIKQDRMKLFTNDTIRSLVFVLLSAGIIWFYLKRKLSENIVVIIFTVLVLIDLVGVNRRYVNNEDFVSGKQVNTPFIAAKADLEIQKDKSHYKVLDLSVNPFNSGRASYFHNALGGYHAAKPRRVQDVMSYQIEKNNLEVLNMMNVKYFIQPDQDGQLVANQNPYANGNAWFIKNLRKVNSVNEEMIALDSLDSKNEAVYYLNKNSELNLTSNYVVDSTASIKLLSFKPNYLEYESSNANNGFVVFSENYYNNGWAAYIDGVEKPHIRVNYLLRGLPIPSGNHKVEFKFEPQVVNTGSKISLASSLLLGILIIGGLFFEIRKNSKSA